MNKISKIAIIILVFATFAGIVYGNVPPPPVNQKLGINDTNVSQLVEQNCRGCHNSTSSPFVSGSVPTRHHNLVANNKINIITNTPYGCQDCHPVITGNGQSVLMDRNCVNCHNGSAFYANKNVIVGRPHHINTNDAKNRSCNACHGSFVDNYNDGHYVPSYNETEITPTTSFKVFNSSSGRYWGGCFACHQPSALTSPNILSNEDNHHGEILGASQILTSAKVTSAPVIDGTPETVWNSATPITFNVTGGVNTNSNQVTLKSVYNDTMVYFLAIWSDPTESARRLPWQKQANGSWKQLATPGAKEGGENTFYEDKFAQIWDINTTGFNKLGCFATCHPGENSDVKAFGNKYTPNPGEIADLWHMKTVRTNPTGYIDDQYVDNTQYSVSTPDAGRHSDPGTAPYFNNINGTGTGPNYTYTDQPAPPYWIFDNLKQSFVDTYNVSDEIAGIIVRPPTGDRANITAKAVYSNGNWTMEYGRKLVTGSQFDVQFSDLNKSYLFGTAIFDNAQTMHSYESGVSKLIFAPNAARKDGTAGLDCKWCHGNTVNISSPDWLDIRSCEQCHSVSTIHNIQYDYTNTSTIRGYGHIGSNNPSDVKNNSWDCKGCHAWYDAGDVNPFAGAIIPDTTSITPNLLKTGLDTVVTIAGSDFLSGVGSFAAKVSIDGTTVLTPSSVTNNQIIVTVPQLTAGVHTIQVVKTGDSLYGDKMSKLSTLTVVVPVDAITAKITKKATKTTPAEITVTGTGFGSKQDPLFTDLGVWITLNTKKTVKTSVLSWNDTKIVVSTPSAQIGNLVTIKALYGQDTVNIS